MPLRRVAILGSTGSIGVNTLDVIRSHPAVSYTHLTLPTIYSV